MCGLDWRIILCAGQLLRLRNIDRLFFCVGCFGVGCHILTFGSGRCCADRYRVRPSVVREGAVRPPCAIGGVGAINFAMFASSSIAIRRASLLRIPRRHLADDSSNYYGPGGLSARQIMDAVQSHDAERSCCCTAITSTKATHRNHPFPRLSPKPKLKTVLKELRRILVSNAIDVSDCFERSDLVARARTHLLKR